MTPHDHPLILHLPLQFCHSLRNTDQRGIRNSYCELGFLFFFQAEDGIRDLTVTGVQTCALPIFFGFSSRASKFAPAGSRSSKCNGRMATFCTVILRSIYAIRPHWRHCGQNGSHLFATSKPLRWRTAIYSTVISWCAADRSTWWTTTACGCRP